MYNEPKNWALTTVVDDTWTDLITGEAAILTGLLISNPTETTTTVSVRLTSSGAVLVPGVSLEAGKTVQLELRSLSIPVTDGIQVLAAVNGPHFVATGAVPSAPL